MIMGKRVLILSASVGSGHVKAAVALERAMRARSDVEEVLCDDSLDHTNLLHRQFYSTLYSKLSTIMPEFLGWWYERSDDPWVADKSRLAIDLPQALPLINLVKDFRPDIILCTHFMPAGVISWLIGNGKLDAQLGVVVTDFHFHAFWITRAFNWYFVAQEEDKIHMEALGLPGDRIEVSGIPVDPEFARPVDAGAVHQAIGHDCQKQRDRQSSTSHQDRKESCDFKRVEVAVVAEKSIEVFHADKLHRTPKCVLGEHALVEGLARWPKEKNQHHRDLRGDQQPGQPRGAKANAFFHGSVCHSLPPWGRAGVGAGMRKRWYHARPHPALSQQEEMPSLAFSPCWPFQSAPTARCRA